MSDVSPKIQSYANVLFKVWHVSVRKCHALLGAKYAKPRRIFSARKKTETKGRCARKPNEGVCKENQTCKAERKCGREGERYYFQTISLASILFGLFLRWKLLSHFNIFYAMTARVTPSSSGKNALEIAEGTFFPVVSGFRVGHRQLRWLSNYFFVVIFNGTVRLTM